MAQNASTGVINFKIFLGEIPKPPPASREGALPLNTRAFGARQTRLPNIKIVPTPLTFAPVAAPLRLTQLVILSSIVVRGVDAVVFFKEAESVKICFLLVAHFLSQHSDMIALLNSFDIRQYNRKMTK